MFTVLVRVPLQYLQDLEEQKRTKYKINGTATTAIEKSYLYSYEYEYEAGSVFRASGTGRRPPIGGGGGGYNILARMTRQLGVRVFDKPTSES